jgi:putative transposase
MGYQNPAIQKPEDLIGEDGLLKRLTKLLVEMALDAEMRSMT